MVTPRSWLDKLRTQIKTRKNRRTDQPEQTTPPPPAPPPTLGIISLEVAKVISKILFLYRSVSDSEIGRVRDEVLRSEGVCGLVSREEGFLLGLGRAERMEELDRVAEAVGRLGRKCSERGLQDFKAVYDDLVRNRGCGIERMAFSGKDMEEKVKKMESFVSMTADLFMEMESLRVMETREQKMCEFVSLVGGRVVPHKGNGNNDDHFRQKLTWQRHRVRHLKEVSLWGYTYDKIVGLMARSVCSVYVRICVGFSPYLPGLPQFGGEGVDSSVNGGKKIANVVDSVLSDQNSCHSRIGKVNASRSGPLQRNAGASLGLKTGDLAAIHADLLQLSYERKQKQSKPSSRVHHIALDLEFEDDVPAQLQQSKKTTHNSTLITEKNWLTHASPSTVGGSALHLRYANVITHVQKMLQYPNLVSDESRCELYQLLPTSLKSSVRVKHRRYSMGRRRKSNDFDDGELERWKNEAERILSWLSPLAHDTLRWQSEHSLEQQPVISRSNVLLMQTLYFADKLKTEEAMAELLVALSFICSYETADE